MEELSRGETRLDLSIRSILLGPCGRHWGGKGKNGNEEAREEADIEGGLTWSWSWKGGQGS